MELEFKTRNQKQLEAAEYWIDNETEQILFGGAKSGGKSFLGASLIFGDALIYPETHYFIARQELIDLRKFTIPTIYEVFQKWGIKADDYMSFNGQDSVFNLKNGSKVFLISCRDIPSDPLYERFGSMQMTRGWIEEAGEIAEAAKANLWLSIGRWKNEQYNLKKKLLLTANPKKGWMKREFVDPFKAGILKSDRRFVSSLPTDNTYNSPDYVATLAAEKDAVRRQRLYLGDWDYDDDKDALVSADALSDLFTNTLPLDNERYMSVDVARKGEDRTVISLWQGLELYRVELRTKQGTDVTEQQIKDLAAAERIPYSHIIIDEDGIGGGVVDHLHGVKGFTANSVAIPTDSQIRERASRVNLMPGMRNNFANLKSQCGWKLAELINDHKMRVRAEGHREAIIEEVSATLKEKDADKETPLRLIPKEEVKEVLGRSPDIGDTLLMRAWFEIQPAAYKADPASNEAQVRLFNRNAANQEFEAA